MYMYILIYIYYVPQVWYIYRIHMQVWLTIIAQCMYICKLFTVEQLQVKVCIMCKCIIYSTSKNTNNHCAMYSRNIELPEARKSRDSAW